MTVEGDLAANVAKLRRQARLAASVHIVFLIAVIAGMAITCIEAGIRLGQEPSVHTGVLVFFAGCIGIGAVWHLISVGKTYAAAQPRVVPYFSNKYFTADDVTRKTSDESQAAFNSGYRIAADLPELDALAHELNIAPLSSFGFGDDLLGQRPEWCDLNEGIRTVTALITAAMNGDTHLSSSTVSELQTLLAALSTAKETQSSFALVVRYGRDDFISGAEMNKREGTYWS